MRTCFTMLLAIAACLSIAAACRPHAEVPMQTVATARVKTRQTVHLQRHSHRKLAHLFRVGSGAGPIHSSTATRPATANSEVRPASTTSGFLRGNAPPGNPSVPYWTDVPKPDDFRLGDFPDYRAVHTPWTVSVIPLRRTRLTGDGL